MADETAPSSSNESKDTLDLNALSGLDFGPDWADGKPTKSSNLKRFEDRGGRKGKGKSPSSRDRRSGGRPQRSRDDRHPKDGGYEKRGGRPQQARPNFEPTVKVDLYPQDEAFDALVKRLRASARTYQLFEIAHLLLEKPERYVVVVGPKQKRQDSGEAKPLLYYSVPGHLPFETEEQAIDYVLKEHIDLFFDVEEVEVEPPSGNFQMVSRCGITGEILGPPNYHRYQDFLQRHYAARITGMSFERFQSKVESSKEQEDIDAWLESMKKGARYTVKDRQASEPETCESLESVRRFLITHRKDKVVGSGESIRFAGRDIERMPVGDIRRSVESYVEQQKHFPLDSANNIRGRLRRHKFAVYKKGSKGVSFVCAVKRKFRDGKTVFTDSIRDLIDFIEKHPDIPASKLSKEYIGIDTEKQKPDVLEMKDNAEDAPPAASEAKEASLEAESVESPEEDAVATKAASTQAMPKAELSDDEQKKLNQLMLDLRWLITEGYVTEYGDGRLYAPAPLPEPSKVAKKTTPENVPTVDEGTALEDEASPSEPVTEIEEIKDLEKTDTADQAEVESEPLTDSVVDASPESKSS